MPAAPLITANDGGTPDRFRQLVESVVDYGMFLLDTQGRVVSWNRGAQQIKQYAAEEVLGCHFSVFYPADAVQAGWPDEELRRAEALGRFEDEGWRVRKDGSRFWANVVITALRAADGRLTGFAKVTRDLSERRRQEEALRASEQRFRLLVEGVKDSAICMLNLDGVVESWNSGAQLIEGYADAEIIGRHCSVFYTADDRAAGLPGRELAQALAEGRVESEGWRLRKDGSAFWARTVLSPMYDSARGLLGFARVTRDLTQTRRTEELEKAGQRMREFLAMLAHELRNPLAPIRNAVTMMQLDPAQSNGVRKSRDIIDRQLTHLTRLVDDLLDAGRLTTGKIQLHRERLRYGEVVERAVEAVRPLADARGHQLDVVLPLHGIEVPGDLVRLVQVLQNLLINAVKFTPAPGRITLEVRCEGSQLYTAVRDTGIGLAAADIEDIFRLFAQGERQGSAHESGLGIGLTLARSLVEMHGGVLHATSEGPGRGSCFEFFLPDAQPAATAQAPAGGAGAGIAHMQCLVVDDNRDAADSMAEVVRMLGLEVQVAYGGEQALALAARCMPQVVLMDLSMPGMDGHALLPRLRALPGGWALAAAAISGYGAASASPGAEAGGFDACMTKPADFEALRDFLAWARARPATP